MIFLSYKFRLRAKSILHPIRTFKALYFIHYIEHTEKWKELIDKDPKKAFEMKWNRYYTLVPDAETSKTRSWFVTHYKRFSPTQQ